MVIWEYDTKCLKGLRGRGSGHMTHHSRGVDLGRGVDHHISNDPRTSLSVTGQQGGVKGTILREVEVVCIQG